MVENSYNYYKKYIKYKNKYLQYKHNLHGGITQPQSPALSQSQPPAPLQPQPQPQPQPLVVVILASHQNAIGELLTMMVKGYAKTRKKLKNCACIEISKVRVRDGGEEIHVKMIHDGELDPKDKSKRPELYFTVDIFNNHNYKFKDEHVGKIGTNVKLILVRHGNGPHNAKTGFFGALVKMSNLDIYTDPLLTQLGIDQAQRAHPFIQQKILEYDNQCKIFLCSSRLRRAIQTVGIIGFHILQSGDSSMNPNLLREIVIVPGVEEIVDDTGNTENTLLSSGLNPENRSIYPIGEQRSRNCDNLYITFSHDKLVNNNEGTVNNNNGSVNNNNRSVNNNNNKSVNITKIEFNNYKSNNSETIAVNFRHMYQNKETIFPLSARFDTAFNVLNEIVIS
jgi:broad specificity phosphatase PhoE